MLHRRRQLVLDPLPLCMESSDEGGGRPTCPGLGFVKLPGSATYLLDDQLCSDLSGKDHI